MWFESSTIYQLAHYVQPDLQPSLRKHDTAPFAPIAGPAVAERSLVAKLAKITVHLHLKRGQFGLEGDPL